jgi:hypothetical protein
MTDETPPIIAVVDEAAPADRGGIYYVVTAALLLEPNRARTALADVIPSDRIRPFHWALEGTQARERMLGVLTEAGVVAHVVVHYPTGRRRQEEARRSAMSELVPLVIADGAGELIIESRSDREDQRDRRSVIDAIHRAGRAIPYRWETKSEPLLWVADAVCGAVKEYLLGEDFDGLDRLQAARVIDDVRYRRVT